MSIFQLSAASDAKTNRRAKQWLDLAETIWRFRRDVLTAAQESELLRQKAELTQLIKARARANLLESSIQRLETLLRKIGGPLYPRSGWAEYIDFILVAVLVVLGIRAYFLQPMIIPTNSMWPTYHGMTAETFPPGKAPPGFLPQVCRLAAYGAVRKHIDAPNDGELSAFFFLDINGTPHLVSSLVEGRSWLVLPTKFSEYTFFVNDQPVKIRLPQYFDGLDQVFNETYFPDSQSLLNQWHAAERAGRIQSVVMTTEKNQHFRAYRVPLGRFLTAGQPILRFDILKGEMVFVDRLSYHFIHPRVGSAFVFETGKIPRIRALGLPDEYLIKRLVGQAGDQLEIREPGLYRNGKPIEGAASFDKNARREGEYRGYFNLPEGSGHSLIRGETITVPPGSLMALGDNSLVSEDGRYWGFVPESEVIGRAFFIYYPFTQRWGLAK